MPKYYKCIESKITDQTILIMEKHTQHALIMSFGQKYPQYRDFLIEINNTVTNINQASARKSMGMVAGASDLLFIDPNTGVASFIELKKIGTTHKSIKVLRQISFGRQMINAGCNFLLTTDIEFILEFISAIIEKNHNLAVHLSNENSLYVDSILIRIKDFKTVTF